MTTKRTTLKVLRLEARRVFGPGSHVTSRTDSNYLVNQDAWHCFAYVPGPDHHAAFLEVHAITKEEAHKALLDRMKLMGTSKRWRKS